RQAFHFLRRASRPFRCGEARKRAGSAPDLMSPRPRGSWRAPFRFSACIGTMNQLGTPLPALSPQGGERVAAGRERGSSWRAPFRFSACIGTMNQLGTPLPTLSPQGGERVAAGRERGASLRASFCFCACIGTMNQIGTPLPALSPQGGERAGRGGQLHGKPRVRSVAATNGGVIRRSGVSDLGGSTG